MTEQWKSLILKIKKANSKSIAINEKKGEQEGQINNI